MQIVVAMRTLADRDNSEEKLACLKLLSYLECDIVVAVAGDSGLLRNALEDEAIPYYLTHSDISVESQ